MNKYRIGFNECANEVRRYLSEVESVDVGLRTRVLDHLSTVVQNVHYGSTCTPCVTTTSQQDAHYVSRTCVPASSHVQSHSKFTASTEHAQGLPRVPSGSGSPRLSNCKRFPVEHTCSSASDMDTSDSDIDLNLNVHCVTFPATDLTNADFSSSKPHVSMAATVRKEICLKQEHNTTNYRSMNCVNPEDGNLSNRGRHTPSFNNQSFQINPASDRSNIRPQTPVIVKEEVSDPEIIDIVDENNNGEVLQNANDRQVEHSIVWRPW
jgi:hypothetical protein